MYSLNEIRKKWNNITTEPIVVRAGDRPIFKGSTRKGYGPVNANGMGSGLDTGGTVDAGGSGYGGGTYNGQAFGESISSRKPSYFTLDAFNAVRDSIDD